MKEKVKILFLAWTFGFLGGLIFLILRLTKRVEIEGYDRRKLEPQKEGLLLISNHPSLFEPVLMPFLFFPYYLFSLRFVPLFVVDKNNYYRGWFSIFRAIFLSVERGSPREEIKSMEKMRDFLNEGKILILYPEGGRTFKGRDFRVSNSRKRIRRFPLGLRKLFEAISSTILPVWVEGADQVLPNTVSFPRFPRFPFPRFWRKTIIRIGEPLKLNKESKEKPLETLEEILLKLGDRG